MKPNLTTLKIFLFSTLLITGCSITQLEHEGLTPPLETKTGTVAISEKASGYDGGKVGWGRVTLFAIPVAPIYIQGDESIQLMDNIQEALVLAGYSAISESENSTSKHLTLNANVIKTRYSNYTWLIPFVPTWGGMEVELSLVNSNGYSVWSEKFKGSGFTFNFTDGYNIASRESMSRLLDSMIIAFSSDDFFNAISNPGKLNNTNGAPE